MATGLDRKITLIIQKGSTFWNWNVAFKTDYVVPNMHINDFLFTPLTTLLQYITLHTNSDITHRHVLIIMIIQESARVVSAHTVIDWAVSCGTET